MLNSIIGTDLSLSAFLICTAASLVLGIGLAFVSQFRARSTQSFAVTLAILPVVVQVVIMLVNGNIGAGVAVAGAFSLVRFRSAPGTAREIGVLFLGMAIGLATGMGYVGLAALTFVIVSTALMALTALGLGQKDAGERLLKITIPEDLDYDGLFDDLFERYTTAHTLEKVKTMQAAAFVPAHAEVTEDIAPLAQYNIDKVLEIADHMVELCAEPVIFEELLKKLFDDL